MKYCIVCAARKLRESLSTYFFSCLDNATAPYYNIGNQSGETNMKFFRTIVPAALCAALSLSLLAGCGGGGELTISIGDGMKENDAVSVLFKYSDTWKEDETIFRINYGHESDAVLADEYTLSFCDSDPTFSNDFELKAVYSFRKVELEGRTVSGGSFSGAEAEIVINDLSDYLPQGEGTQSVYLVLHSTDTDFKNITTFSAHEFTYEWQEDGVTLVSGS